MKLKVNLISGGRYYKAGEDIPEDELPDFASRYASEVADGDGVDASSADEIQRQRSDADDLDKPKVKVRLLQAKASPSSSVMIGLY